MFHGHAVAIERYKTMIKTIFTIGGYGFTEESFFRRLVEADVDLFCDVRQRRGLRGRKFAFLNATRLQDHLRSIEIPYAHFKDFAPTTEIRNRQKEADSRQGIQKRNREMLGEEFVSGYRSDILTTQSPESFLSQLPKDCLRPCLFCVECKPEACHRSLMSEWLANAADLEVVHLLP